MHATKLEENPRVENVKMAGGKSGRGLPQSKTLSRQTDILDFSHEI